MKIILRHAVGQLIRWLIGSILITILIGVICLGLRFTFESKFAISPIVRWTFLGTIGFSVLFQFVLFWAGFFATKYQAKIWGLPQEDIIEGTYVFGMVIKELAEPQRDNFLKALTHYRAKRTAENIFRS